MLLPMSHFKDSACILGGVRVWVPPKADWLFDVDKVVILSAAAILIYSTVSTTSSQKLRQVQFTLAQLQQHHLQILSLWWHLLSYLHLIIKTCMLFSIFCIIFSNCISVSEL